MLHKKIRAKAPALSAASAMPLPVPGSWVAAHDPRWPQLAAKLLELRQQGRHAIRIVDADCGAGALLLHAVLHARALGFLAVEGRGIDGSPALIGRARAAAARCEHPAIGSTFEVADMIDALRQECELPADIVLCRGLGAGRYGAEALQVIYAAGDLVISDVDRSLEVAA